MAVTRNRRSAISAIHLSVLPYLARTDRRSYSMPPRAYWRTIRPVRSSTSCSTSFRPPSSKAWATPLSPACWGEHLPDSTCLDAMWYGNAGRTRPRGAWCSPFASMRYCPRRSSGPRSTVWWATCWRPTNLCQAPTGRCCRERSRKERFERHRREGIRYGEQEQAAARSASERLGVPLPWD